MLNYFALYRISTIVIMSIKFFIQVLMFQKKHKNNFNQQKWNELLQRQAREYKETALKIEGLLIKLGQFLSTRADILPKVFLEELADLVDKVPPVKWEPIKQVLEDEWGTSYGNIVSKISEQPVASASIGVVYHGYLQTGESVAIKVQRPKIDKIIKADFRALRIVMWLANKFTKFGKSTDLRRLFLEIKLVISNELDFRKELKNGQYFQNRYNNIPNFKVPCFYEDHTTKKVLVMEWMDGVSILDTSFLRGNNINGERLAETLLTGFLEQLLQEGKFHADPHTGNILIQADGTIVLLDFGMVGEIKKKDAAAIRRLVQAIVLQNYHGAIEALEDLRFLLPNADKDKLASVLEFFIQTLLEQDFVNMDADVAEHIFENVQQVVKEQPIQLPSEFAFFGRAVSTLVGILYLLHPNINVIEVAKPLVLNWIQDRTADTSKGFKEYIQSGGQQLITAFQKAYRLLDEPDRHRKWQEIQYERQQRDLQSQWRVHYVFIFGVISLVTVFVSIFFAHQLLLIVSSSVFLISFAALVLLLARK
ncbi:AarF/ABC1/UbiB kinase family protein [Bacillus sp. HMF5848]|uniref:ABC1 kinase family protein n=1 Tax=Bacillus sp. HMF5848 TaxID=2495421 RepID=UPI000F7ADC18|nr:AarF/UbiB family protein [Bacillus sp. HMF5848]RSK27161.1 AarF/ABC1/UbiB kinase family protein [Bacillus sp. HMF5848]